MFRVSARVVDPDGEGWEIYTYRVRVLARGATYEPDLYPERLLSSGFPGSDLYVAESALMVVDALIWLLGLVPRLLLRLFWDVPRAGIHALRSDECTIEAVTWYPHRKSHIWTTSRAHRQSVISQVADALAHGQQPTPRDAHYVGLQEEWNAAKRPIG